MASRVLAPFARLSRSLRLGFFCLGLGLVAPLDTAHASGPWEKVANEDGITVTTRDEDGRQFPTFRGVGDVRASIYEILAVLEDADRHAEWMHDCGGAKNLKRVNENTRIVYNRTDAPWPVKDRDVVLRSKLKIIQPGKELKARFTSITSPLKGEVEDVVRMPHLEGFWHLVQINEKLTKVTYQVNADPAGMLPDWLVVMTSRDIPLHTLKGLRDQVAKTKGEYTDFVSRWKAKG